MNRKPTTLIGKLATILILLVFLLPAAPVSLDATGLYDTEVPGNGNSPDRIIHTVNAKPGVYYFDFGGSGYSFDPNVYPVEGAIRFWGWSEINPSSGVYRWDKVDSWLTERKALGLGAGIALTTYDGDGAGDIRSTPDYVIKTADTVLPATYKTCSSCAENPHYVDYFRPARLNPGFDWAPNTFLWTLTGGAAVVTTPPADPDNIAAGNAVQLGGTVSSTATAYHAEERIPAMPSGITPALKAYVTARVHIATTDVNPNDHLYMELWDTNNVKLGGTQVDITNLAHANNSWATYTFDVSSFAPERSVRVAFRTVNDATDPTTFYVDSVGVFVRHLIPKYWSTAYTNAYRTFITALGARYKTNQDVQFVAIGTGLNGENQPTQDGAYPYNFDHVVANAGLDSGKWTTYVNTITDAYAAAFNLIPGQGPNRHLLLQYSPVFQSTDERRLTTDHAAGSGAGVSANTLSPDLTQAFRTDGNGQYDPIRKYYNQVPVAFESYPSDLCSPVLALRAVASAVEKHADFLRADIALVRNWSDGSLTANAPFYDWAGNYLGKTVQNTPRVWTMMHEHRNPTRLNCRAGGGLFYASPATGTGIYPQLGNFNYWLYQVDGIPGGRTVPETNDKGADSRYARSPDNGTTWPLAGLGACPTSIGYRTDLYGFDYPCNNQPYNPDLPALLSPAHLADYTKWYTPQNWLASGKEAYVVRRTDQKTDPAQNNPYMFFMIDDGYMDPLSNLVFGARIRVKYFDMGTDKWSLKYQSTSGEKVAGIITKTGTKTYKETEFVINDGKFANGLTGGADFYLDSRDPATNANDGNEWVYMVEVEKFDAQNPPTVTPTPTATATESPTPTVTPTATPSTGIVEGKAFHDANSNGVMDPVEPGVAGAVMALKQAGVEIYTAISDATGQYRFPAVSPGQYQLVEKSPPPGYLHNTVFLRFFQVNANETLSGDFFNVGHQPVPTPTATASPTATATLTATPTATATATPPQRKIYLPIVVGGS